MQKTSQNNRTAIDKTRNTCYNTDMKNKENKMTTEKNMQKTSQNSRTAIDKSEKTCYNTDMKNKNTLTKENKMTFTKFNTRVNHLTTHEMVASKIEKGLTNELRIICEIGQILRDMGKNHTQVNFLMNNEDFLTNVLSCYKG
jgi:hypothetical protein